LFERAAAGLALNLSRTSRLVAWLPLVLLWTSAVFACPPVKPLRFAPGASEARIEGGVPRGMRDCLSLGLRQGQRLTVQVLPGEDDNIVFQIYRPGWTVAGRSDAVTINGTALPGTAEGLDARAFDGTLPASGTYLLVIGTTRGGGAYRISVGAR